MKITRRNTRRENWLHLRGARQTVQHDQCKKKKGKAALYSTAVQLSSLFWTLERAFLCVLSFGTHFLHFVYCFWLSVLSHRSENGSKATKWHKTRRDRNRRDRNSRTVRTTETSRDASAIGCWYFLVITKATAGCKHKTTSPKMQALLQLYFALQARSSEGAEND